MTLVIRDQIKTSLPGPGLVLESYQYQVIVIRKDDKKVYDFCNQTFIIPTIHHCNNSRTFLFNQFDSRNVLSFLGNWLLGWRSSKPNLWMEDFISTIFFGCIFCFYLTLSFLWRVKDKDVIEVCRLFKKALSAFILSFLGPPDLRSSTVN